MKRLMISAFALVAFFAAATTVLRSHSSATSFAGGTASTMSVQERHGVDVNKLPIEDFEDQSLVYSTAPKR
jgi:hypothetical protein